MKNIQWILLPLCLSLSLSCGKKASDNDDGLTFTTSSKIDLINGSLYSCADLQSTEPTTPSLKPVSGKSTAVKIIWGGEGTLEIQRAFMTIRGGALTGGKQVIEFSVEGLTYASAPGVVKTVDCGFRFGELKLKDVNKPAFLTGVIEMRGVATDSEDNSKTVKATYEIDLQYEP